MNTTEIFKMRIRIIWKLAARSDVNTINRIIYLVGYRWVYILYRYYSILEVYKTKKYLKATKKCLKVTK